MSMEPNQPLLQVSQLGLKIPTGRWLFSSLNFSVSAGEAIFILGPNGSGKTSLLRCLLGDQRPTQGRLDWSISDREVVYLPQVQSEQVHAPLTLLEMVQIFVPHPVSSAEVEQVGLLETEKFDTNWNYASGGEQKRTLVTSCLLQKPRVLILDEPFNHLDRGSRYVVAQSFRTFLEEGGAMLMVTHEVDVVKGSGIPAAEVIQL